MSFVNVDRDTPMLLPVDLRDWIGPDDPVHFVLEAVDRVDLSCFRVRLTGAGKAQYPPPMLLALLIHCYSQGVFSSRRIERATYRDIGVRYLTGDTHPDHDTICKFRRENFAAIGSCFLEVLKLARELKLFKLGTVSLDGTHLKANASKDRNVTYDRAAALEKQLEGDIAALLEKAEQVDTTEKGHEDKLPEELRRRQNLKAKMEQAQRQLEARARTRAASGQEAYEDKERAWKARNGKGPRPKPPADKPGGKEQSNLTDPDSRVMRKERQGTTQSYNAQAVVDADGSQLIVGARISQCSADNGELEKNLASIPAALGQPDKALADSGFIDSAAFQRIEANGIDLYVSVQSEASLKQRKYDFRPDPDKAPRNLSNQVLIDMRDKLKTQAGKEIYSKRQQTVEPVFGIIKAAMGFRQFLLRGIAKVKGEWNLVCLAYNIKRLYNLKYP